MINPIKSLYILHSSVRKVLYVFNSFMSTIAFTVNFMLLCFGVFLFAMRKNEKKVFYLLIFITL